MRFVNYNISPLIVYYNHSKGARPEGKGRRMYRERKDLELAKTVTYSRLLYIRKGPVPSTKLTPSRTQNRGYLYYNTDGPAE